jgi:hypothetical protein
MKNLYLHIGIEKTGSTSIQEFLTRYNSELQKIDYHYIGNGQSMYFLSCLGFNRGNKDILSSNGLDNELDTFMECLIENEHKNIIISQENFWEGDPLKFKKIIKQYKNQIKFKVIIYIREQFSWFVSWYQQILKEVYTFDKSFNEWNYPLEYVNYLKKITNWKNVFEEKNVTVRLFEEAKEDNGLIKDFLNSIEISNFNLSTKELNLKNESLGSASVDFLRKINSLKNKQMHDMAVSFLLNNNPLKNEKSFKGMINASVKNRIKSHYIESNKKLAKSLSLEYSKIANCEKENSKKNIDSTNNNVAIDFLFNKFIDYLYIYKEYSLINEILNRNNDLIENRHEIHIGFDGWLFLAKDSNNVLSQYKEPFYNKKSFDDWKKLLISRKCKLRDSGIKYFHIIAPEKITIYSEKSKFDNFDFLNSASDSFDRYSEKEIRELLIIPNNYFRNIGKKIYYHKTDTHWNFNGAIIVYNLLMNKLGYKGKEDFTSRIGPKVKNILDLGGKINPPIEEVIQYYKSTKHIVRIFKNELVSFKEKNKLENSGKLHVGSYVKYRNKKCLYDRKVMIFGDSFSEYRLHLLTGLLAETFYEVSFVWSSNIDYNLIDISKPDFVISELAERFMCNNIPKDNMDLNLLANNKINNYLKKGKMS